MSSRNIRQGFSTESKRKHEQNKVLELRKTKREAQLSKLRDQPMIQPPKLDSTAIQTPTTTAEFQQAATDLTSLDYAVRYTAACSIRLACAQNTHEVYEQVVTAGIIPLMVEVLTNGTPDIQLEAAWVLTNVASGSKEHTSVVIQACAIPALIQGLRSESISLAMQCAWAIGNIANEGEEYRNDFMARDVAMMIGELMSRTDITEALARNLVWSLGSVIRQPVDAELHHKAHIFVPLLERMLNGMDLTTSEPKAIAETSDLLYCIGYICDGDDLDIEACCTDSIIAPVCRLAMGAPKVAAPAIRILGNITSGPDDRFTDFAIQHGALAALSYCLSSPRSYIRREALWAVSNVSAGTEAQLTAVLTQGLLADVLKMVMKDTIEVRDEALYVVMNFSCNATAQQVYTAATELDIFAVLMPLCRSQTKAKPLQIILSTTKYLLTAVSKDATMLAGLTDAIIEAGGKDQIEILLTHPSERVRSGADYLVETFFRDGDSDMEDDVGEYMLNSVY